MMRTVNTMIDSFASWARMERENDEEIRHVDTAITVVGTLLVATTWALIQH